jgi:hypothetical protein
MTDEPRSTAKYQSLVISGYIYSARGEPLTLTSSVHFSTGIENAFAAAGDITTEVLPKLSMHHKGKY